jgi:hypothetical protein
LGVKELMTVLDIPVDVAQRPIGAVEANLTLPIKVRSGVLL